ncbi:MULTISPECIES: ankyrin repeat domain-containing protein [unclassified Wolbachia]|uniref:ankyrin repeat domain-containing protein n=2 Tax=unclassified Wolbachia TaxID=2640676 RepID=UPI00221EDE84|nr:MULTISPECIES: ankyrin repeat domain-containing protein [unclassified Wolbachia]
MRDELTLLHIAAEYSNEKVVQALLGAGASVNAVDSCGRTPLDRATASNSLEVVQALLDAGADPTLEDKNGKTTDDIAQQEAKRELRGIVTEQAIKKAMKVGAICGVIAGLAVGGGCFAADAALPILALIGIAVAAAVLTGLVAGGITYKISKPSEKLDSVDAEQKLVQRQVL